MRRSDAETGDHDASSIGSSEKELSGSSERQASPLSKPPGTGINEGTLGNWVNRDPCRARREGRAHRDRAGPAARARAGGRRAEDGVVT
jgi:hypothetical protein